jgi:hypothetical protein
MTKRNWVLISLALALAGVYIFCFTDWFKTKTIHITSTNARVNRVIRAGNSATIPVIFKFERPYELTELKVVDLDDFQTNKLAEPLWHLVSDSGSDDVDQFFYGGNIDGMDPAVEGARPEPLQPGVTYRLFVTAGKIKGWHDFKAKSAN